MTSPPLHDRRIVLVSNRGPVTFTVAADGPLRSRRGAGGLISGIGPLVKGTGTIWIAAAMTEGDRQAAATGVAEAEGFRLRMLAVDPDTYQLAYDEVSNGVLWFAHHGLWDLPRQPAFDRSWPAAWDAYRAVNHAFANAVAEVAPDRAIVLVQDYHLCLVAARLAVLRPDLDCVHFSHTPFAPPVWLAAIPTEAGRELLQGLAAHRACGFHTQQWATDFTDSARQLAGLTPTTFVAPLATDPDDIKRAAAAPACQEALATLQAKVGDRTVIARVDRLELSKNLLRGFLAFDELLRQHPEHRGEVVFVAEAYPSRPGVAAYARYRDEIERAVAEINQRWGTADWQPISLSVEDNFPAAVALMRRGDVFLVNPIRDGLNLVASEAILVNERNAVLALSAEAGAWEGLQEGALRVAPFDVAGTAGVLHEAVRMPAEERRRRAVILGGIVRAHTPAQWLAHQIAAAEA